ncbi:DNA polymerase III subunit gamma/tau [Marinilactibacillus psychrotolerans]|uniref:DNA-directed DNA polymerase n=1 Tax=Marinilactibacillus psychrotolerans TaxID=191770 RepID=A0AAV3WSQ1_9LACT|nr:DNA polymerase III subunit gamma/tau [Marinilactibacillus psychrotolerans]GEL67662.1 DNA polymerase III subunit gamma/tau [Marinilactibacillus psychrotolerans]GEQ36532.1 DNA polymerase III subunit gamma/tau [Marinilactibacillus psychrotolerans]SDD14097.1 DNA polymerase-3 subunit gamma/tau [Marinilactibacillus psychrotolerans]
MSYQALYRVWRPQKFEDIAGQQAITKTLRNAIVQDKTSHAYLFTGPRGTGKTSAAKIFAKAINCPHVKEGEPCNDCEICQSISQGKLGDVIEIDAASNNGVEEIRDIRDKANYAPTQAEYKVYIIDEVHMLSMGAFNALLKTLEEPPANVIFILATTEPHKIPLTIISRTQRFDFRRISPQDIVSRMKYILTQKSVEFEEDALTTISKAAEGGMRDALSILDQALSFSEGKLKTEDAMRITGSITQELLSEYIRAVYTRETEKGLNILHELIAEGKDPSRFVEDIILFSRDVLLYQTAQSDILLKMGKADDKFIQLSTEVDSILLYEVIKIFNQTQQEMRLSNHAEVYLEVATVRLTQPTNPYLKKEEIKKQPEVEEVSSAELSDLKKQLADMQRLIQNISGSEESVKAAPSKPKRSKSSLVFKVNRPSVYKVLEKATKNDLAQLKDVWPDLMNVLEASQKAIMNTSTPVAASPQGLVVTFDYDILCERATNDTLLLNTIGEYLEKVIGHRAELISVPAEQWPVIRQEFIKRMKEEPGDPSDVHSENTSPQEEKEETEPIVSEAFKIFGEQIVKVED